MAGAGIADTVLTQPLQALVVEVRGPGGRPAINTVVRFQAVAPSDSTRRSQPAMFVCSLSVVTCGGDWAHDPWYPAAAPGVVTHTTDADGRAKIVYRLGVVAGVARVWMTVPEFGMADSVSFTVRPGAAAGVRMSVPDTALPVGARATLTGDVVDRFGNARDERPTLSVSDVAVVDFDAATGALTARDIGTAWVVARSGRAADSSSVRVVPAGRIVAWDDGAVRLVNLDGSAGRVLAGGVRSDFGVFPRFDATRTRVTYHSGSESWGGAAAMAVVLDTVGGHRRSVGAGTLTHVRAVRQIADGTLHFLAQRAPAQFSSPTSVWRADAEGNVTEVAAVPEFWGGYAGGDISPNGKFLAYEAAPSGFGAGGGLRVLNLETGAVTALDALGRSARWSPDGTRIAYLVGTQYGGLDGTLAVIAADGSGRRALTTASYSPGLAWSPDGVYIIGRSSSHVDPGLRIVQVQTGNAVTVRVRMPADAHTGFVGYVDLYQPDWR